MNNINIRLPIRNFFQRYISIQEFLAVFFLSCILLFLSLYKIERYPSPDDFIGYIDDAQHLLAAKELAINGRFDFGPSLGMTVFLPVVFAMRLFSPSHLTGHLVMVVFLLCNTVLFYFLVRFLGNWKIAGLATLIYLIAPGINTIYFGRRMMGEVPAVMFMLASIIVWYKSINNLHDKLNTWRLILSGLLIGLAIITKNQFILMIPPWIIVWIINKFYYRQVSSMFFMLPIISAGILILVFYSAQFYLFSNNNQLADKTLSLWSGAFSRGLLTFSFRSTREAIRWLIEGQGLNGPALFGFVIPSLLYAGLRSVRRSLEGLQWSLIFLICFFWWGWFILLSVGWPRYAFTGLTLSVIFVSFFFHDITGGFNINFNKFKDNITGQWDVLFAGRAIFIIFLIMVIGRNLIEQAQYTMTKGCDTHIQMSNYIKNNVPVNAVIETYQPEVCFLSEHNCHLPDNSAQDAVIRYVWYGDSPPYIQYPLTLPYLLIGYTSNLSGLYNPNEINEKYYSELELGDKESTVCTYTLYHRKLDQ